MNLLFDTKIACEQRQRNQLAEQIEGLNERRLTRAFDMNFVLAFLELSAGRACFSGKFFMMLVFFPAPIELNRAPCRGCLGALVFETWLKPKGSFT